MAKTGAFVPAERIERAILLVRGQKVMLDADLAVLYGVPTKRLNQQVSRNARRFPGDFMFRLTATEASLLRSQFATLKPGRGEHRKYLPYAFTQEGVAMLSSVLQSPRAVRVNIEIMRTFVRLRGLLTSNEALARKLDALEQKYDAQFKVVFDALRQLMAPAAAGQRLIGFRPSAKPVTSGRLGRKRPEDRARVRVAEERREWIGGPADARWTARRR